MVSPEKSVLLVGIMGPGEFAVLVGMIGGGEAGVLVGSKGPGDLVRPAGTEGLVVVIFDGDAAIQWRADLRGGDVENAGGGGMRREEVREVVALICFSNSSGPPDKTWSKKLESCFIRSQNSHPMPIPTDSFHF